MTSGRSKTIVLPLNHQRGAIPVPEGCANVVRRSSGHRSVDAILLEPTFGEFYAAFITAMTTKREIIEFIRAAFRLRAGVIDRKAIGTNGFRRMAIFTQELRTLTN